MLLKAFPNYSVYHMALNLFYHLPLLRGLFKVKSEIQFIFVSLVLAQRVMFKIHQSVVPRSAGDRKISAEVLAKLLRVGST